MSNVSNAAQLDDGKLNAFVGQMLNDLGGASSIAMVRIGDALGLYKELHARGPMTSSELADTCRNRRRRHKRFRTPGLEIFLRRSRFTKILALHALSPVLAFLVSTPFVSLSPSWLCWLSWLSLRLPTWTAYPTPLLAPLGIENHH